MRAIKVKIKKSGQEGHFVGEIMELSPNVNYCVVYYINKIAHTEWRKGNELELINPVTNNKN